MLSVILLTLLAVAVSHWFFEPLLASLTPMLALGWLGWGLLAAVVWAFANSDEAR